MHRWMGLVFSLWSCSTINWLHKADRLPGFGSTMMMTMFVIALILIIIGITGNSLSIAVILRGRFRNTSTGIYLVALAIADTLCLIFPFSENIVQSPIWLEYDIENENSFLCLFYNYIIYWIPHVSVWCCAAISVERIIVCHFPYM